MRIQFSSKGSFAKTEAFLQAMSKGEIYAALERYAQKGVDALAKATPVNTGLTGSLWTYEITHGLKTWHVVWSNTHRVDGVPIAIILQYGHGTGTGGYVQGIDYINPVIKPIFDEIANEVWKAVTSA